MRRNFFLESATLIILGVALGLLARYILGDPVSPTDHSRTFNSPIDVEAVESSQQEEDFDFPLLPNWSSELP